MHVNYRKVERPVVVVKAKIPVRIQSALTLETLKVGGCNCVGAIQSMISMDKRSHHPSPPLDTGPVAQRKSLLPALHHDRRIRDEELGFAELHDRLDNLAIISLKCETERRQIPPTGKVDVCPAN